MRSILKLRMAARERSYPSRYHCPFRWDIAPGFTRRLLCCPVVDVYPNEMTCLLVMASAQVGRASGLEGSCRATTRLATVGASPMAADRLCESFWKRGSWGSTPASSRAAISATDSVSVRRMGLPAMVLNRSTASLMSSSVARGSLLRLSSSEASIRRLSRCFACAIVQPRRCATTFALMVAPSSSSEPMRAESCRASSTPPLRPRRRGWALLACAFPAASQGSRDCGWQSLAASRMPRYACTRDSGSMGTTPASIDHAAATCSFATGTSCMVPSSIA